MSEEEQQEQDIFAKYNKRFRPQEYQQVFYAPQSGHWRIDASYLDGFFESAKLLVQGVRDGRLQEGIEGVAAVFLCRHYLELAIKYALFHSRWLKSSGTNASASDIAPVGKGHDLQKLWDTLTTELNAKQGIDLNGLDLPFVGEFVREFHAIDKSNWRFRYPGEQLPAEVPAEAMDEYLRVDYKALLGNLERAHDVLSTLDSYFLNTHGDNEEWEAIQGSW